MAAPQLGQLRLGLAHLVLPLRTPYGRLHASYVDRLRLELALQRTFKIPLGPRAAAKNVEAQAAEFRKGMAGQMGFSKQAQARDPARLREIDATADPARDEASSRPPAA